MKAVLNNRIYLNCDLGSELEGRLLMNLRYEINREPISPYPDIINNVTRITDSVVSIPSGRADLIPDGYEIIDKRRSVKVRVPDLKASLRPDQQKAVDYLTGSGLVEAQPG